MPAACPPTPPVTTPCCRRSNLTPPIPHTHTCCLPLQYAGTTDGLPRGDMDIEVLPPSGENDGGPVYNVRVPAGQAALLVTKASTP